MNRVPSWMRKVQANIQHTSRQLRANIKVPKQLSQISSTKIPEMPKMPKMPKMPDMSEIPKMPKLPKLPNVNMPNVSNINKQSILETQKNISRNMGVYSNKIQSQVNELHANEWPVYKQKMKDGSSKLTEMSKQKWNESAAPQLIQQQTKKLHETMDRKLPKLPAMPEIPKVPKVPTVPKVPKIPNVIQSGYKTSTHIADTGESMKKSAKHSLESVSNAKQGVQQSVKVKYTKYQAWKSYWRSRPSAWVHGAWKYVQSMKTSIISFCVIGITSLMVVNQTTFLTLVYVIRHRYDPQFLSEHSWLAANMKMMCALFNVPYMDTAAATASSTTELATDATANTPATAAETAAETAAVTVANAGGSKSTAAAEDNNANVNESNANANHARLDESESSAVVHQQQIMQAEQNIFLDMQLANVMYQALLYPRLCCALLLTFGIGSPFLRLLWRFKGRKL